MSCSQLRSETLFWSVRWHWGDCCGRFIRTLQHSQRGGQFLMQCCENQDWKSVNESSQLNQPSADKLIQIMTIQSYFLIFIHCSLIRIIQGQNPSEDVSSLWSGSFVPLLHLSQSLMGGKTLIRDQIKVGTFKCLLWKSSSAQTSSRFCSPLQIGFCVSLCRVWFYQPVSLITEWIHIARPGSLCCTVPPKVHLLRLSHFTKQKRIFWRSGTDHVFELIAPSCE